MGILVERVGRRIHLTGWAGMNTKIRCKRIPGHTAKWDKTVTPNKFVCWTYPLDYTTCVKLRREFGDELTIGPELHDWAKLEKKKNDGLKGILDSAAFDLPAVEAVAPRLAAAMGARTYQQVGAAFMHRAQRSCIADDPGLGKTLQIMGAIVEAGITGPILVTAPSAAIQVTWPTELRHWLPDDDVYVATGDRMRRVRVINKFTEAVKNAPDKRHWLLGNFEMARAHPGRPEVSKLCPQPGPFAWSHTDKKTKKVTKGLWHHAFADLFTMEWGAIIADESQKALITRTSEKVDQSQLRAGMGMLRIREGGLRIAASGTPWRGKKENFWGTLNWLKPEQYKSYWNWVKLHFETYEDGMSLILGDLKPGHEEDFYRELDSIMIRRRKSEVVPELPPKQYAGAPLDPDRPESLHGIWLEMDKRQKKSYDEMVLHAATQLESGTLLATGVLAEMTRLKQFASCYGDMDIKEVWDKKNGVMREQVSFLPRLPSNKFDWLVEWLDERGHLSGEGDGKVIIASQFTQIINMFRTELQKMGVESWAITGETSAKKRVAAKEGFQANGGPRVFFLNTDAGGVSLTLDAADDLIFLDEKWVPDDQTQVEDRAHRVSRMHQVTIWYLRSLGTIEEHIGLVNEDRDQMQLTLLDGRRGVDFAKVLLKGA